MKFRLNLTKDEVEEMKRHLYLTDEELLLIQMVVEDRTIAYMSLKLNVSESNVSQRKVRLKGKIEKYFDKKNEKN